MGRRSFVTRGAAVILACASALLASCSPEFIINQTAVRRDSISITIINNTLFRAAFTIGSYDALDKNPPGQAETQQIRIEGRATNPSFNFGCRRNLAVGTARLLDRMRELDLDLGANFDPDSFVEVVNFSSATADSDAAALPTEGTAAGREFLLGVDYSCSDRLFIIFETDADAPGGFRIDFELVTDPNTNPLN